MSDFTTIDANYGTYDPCMRIVQDKGYAIQVKVYKSRDPGSRCLYFAAGPGIHLVGNSAPELLGLVVLWETYGVNWNKQKIDIIPDITSEEEEDE